jgi:hypothetical protein
MADEATETEQQAPVRQRKFKLPASKDPENPLLTPVEFHHHLVDNGHAKPTMNTAQIYILGRAAKNNGMPFKHYDKDGTEYDELQTHPTSGETITRPGIPLKEGTEWWLNRPKRQAGGAKKDKEKGSEAGEVEAEEGAADAAAEAAADEDDLDEEFGDEDGDEAE